MPKIASSSSACDAVLRFAVLSSILPMLALCANTPVGLDLAAGDMALAAIPSNWDSPGSRLRGGRVGRLPSRLKVGIGAVVVAERMSSRAVGGPRDTLRRYSSSLLRARSRLWADRAGFTRMGRFVAVPGFGSRFGSRLAVPMDRTTSLALSLNIDIIFGPPSLRLICLQTSGKRAEKLQQGVSE